MKKLVVFIALVSFSACNGKVVKTSETVDEITNKNYQETLEQFVPSLVDHFPDELHSSRMSLDYSLNEEKGEIGVTLYEYELSDEMIKKILDSADHKAVEVYNSFDTCLLVINQNRLGSIFSNQKAISRINYNDSTQNCFVNLLPIPNFSGFSPNQQTQTIRGSFNMYIFQTGQNQLETNYDLHSNVYFPEKWEHGFSKGVAINESENIVIYWGVTW